jgi:hypothetical protein
MAMLSWAWGFSSGVRPRQWVSLKSAALASPERRHTFNMTEKRLKRPRDTAQLAKFIVDVATGAIADIPPPKKRRERPIKSKKLIQAQASPVEFSALTF